MKNGRLNAICKILKDHILAVTRQGMHQYWKKGQDSKYSLLIHRQKAKSSAKVEN
jgi:hypothetical protein